MAATQAGLGLTSPVADGGTAHVLDTVEAYTSGTLLRLKNNGVSKFAIDFDGVLSTLAVAGTSSLKGAVEVTAVAVADYAVKLLRSVSSPQAGNAHGFVDGSTVSRSGGIGYASFDARIVTGVITDNFDHFAGFQAIATLSTSGVVGKLYGLYFAPVVNTGTVTASFGVKIDGVTGTGAVTTEYGVFINTLSKGTAKWAIFTGANDSLFGGDVWLYNSSGSVASGATIKFASGGSTTLEASIGHEIQSATRGDLVFKVRTAVGATLTEMLRLNGGATPAGILTGTLAVSGNVAIGAAAVSASAALLLPLGTTAVASLRIPHGAAPNAPVNGDMWTTTAGLFVRINGTTKTVTLT